MTARLPLLTGSRSRRSLARALLAGGMALGLAAIGTAPAALAQAKKADPAKMVEILKAGPLGDRVLGKDDAPITIVEYASLTCSHCAAFHEGTFPALKEKYIDTGKVRLIFREFPFDPLSTAASMIARCSTEARYFPLVSVYFKQQQGWAGSDKPLDAMLAIARQAGFTQESFEACLKDQKIYDGLNAQKKYGAETLGVNATPTFFINGEKKSGNMPIEDFDKLIEPLLKQ